MVHFRSPVLEQSLGPEMEKDSRRDYFPSVIRRKHQAMVSGKDMFKDVLEEDKGLGGRPCLFLVTQFKR